MKKCLIISGGDYACFDTTIEYDYCIACDKGFEYAKRMGIKPDIVIGDFDSIDEKMAIELQKLDCVMTYPVEKDDTDTMLAIKKALSLGFEHIVIVCALGGRLDHTMANIQSMHYVASHGGYCEMIGDGEYCRTLSSGKCILSYESGKSLSLFSLTDECTNLTIKGAKYEVSDVTLTNSFPLGLGNSWKDEQVEISIGSGILLIMKSQMVNQ